MKSSRLTALIEEKMYLALDLELNTPDRAAKSKADFGVGEADPIAPAKIIQVGISVGMWPSCSIIHTEARYVKIDEPIFPHITRLTGITNENIQQEGQAHLEIKNWISSIKELYKPFTNPITWGHSDLDELTTEMEANTDEPFHLMGRRPVDVKTIFTFMQIVNHKASKLGLKGALGRYGLGFKGLQHRADIDAMNTLRLFFHMLTVEAEIQYHLFKANTLLNNRV